MSITKEAEKFLPTPSLSDAAKGVVTALAIRGIGEVKDHYREKLRKKLFDKENYKPEESILKSRLHEAKTHPVRTALKVGNTALLATLLSHVPAIRRDIRSNPEKYMNTLNDIGQKFQ